MSFRSRQYLAETTTVIGDPWSARFKNAYASDAMASKQLKEPSGGFAKTTEGLLTFAGKAYVPTALQEELIQEMHELPAHGQRFDISASRRIRRFRYFRSRRILAMASSSCSSRSAFCLAMASQSLILGTLRSQSSTSTSQGTLRRTHSAQRVERSLSTTHFRFCFLQAEQGAAISFPKLRVRVR